MKLAVTNHALSGQGRAWFHGRVTTQMTLDASGTEMTLPPEWVARHGELMIGIW